MTVNMENVVGSGNIGREVDLNNLATDADPDDAEVEYDETESHWLRTTYDNGVVLLFSSGSYIIVGCNSPTELLEVRDKFISMLSSFGIVDEDVEDNFSVKNIVSTAMLDREPPINLNALSIGIGLNTVEYEPEQFPGLIYRPTDVDCVVMVYTSGKIVITGARNKEQAEQAKDSINQTIEDVFGGI